MNVQKIIDQQITEILNCVPHQHHKIVQLCIAVMLAHHKIKVLDDIAAKLGVKL